MSKLLDKDALARARERFKTPTARKTHTSVSGVSRSKFGAFKDASSAVEVTYPRSVLGSVDSRPTALESFVSVLIMLFVFAVGAVFLFPFLLLWALVKH